MVYGATAPAGPLAAAPTRRRRGVAGLFVATLGGSLLLGLRVAGPSRARLAALVARPHTQTLVDPVDIRIAVSNEYGPCETDKYPFLYGIDDALLVEPHKTTSLTIENSVAGAAYAWTAGPYANPNDGVDGPSITVTYTKTGVHALSVEGTVDGTATTHRFTVYAKYVLSTRRRAPGQPAGVASTPSDRRNSAAKATSSNATCAQRSSAFSGSALRQRHAASARRLSISLRAPSSRRRQGVRSQTTLNRRLDAADLAQISNGSDRLDRSRRLKTHS